MNETKSKIIFPAVFPLKVMGLNSVEFRSAVKAIVQNHVSGEIIYEEQPSSGGKYVSITATFTAESKEQLDALYRELHGNKLVLMTL